MRQAQALSVMMGGEPVFLTGPPGAGKTYVLNEFVKRATQSGKVVAVTASTGIAATHIGGTTIHSWSGLGIRDRLESRDRQQLSANTKLVKRYNTAEVLVIDEISMLHAHRLDMVNQVCKLLRQDSRPFGGLQVILVGDLFQLPPVSRNTEKLDFVHLSSAWQELEPKICYLSEQHRQQGDELLDLLEAMRSGELEMKHQELLQQRLGMHPAIDQPVTRLYAHNVDIDMVNQRHLAAIEAETKLYDMQTKGSALKVEQLRRSVLAPEELELKIGAEVMFVANNPSAGFVNGSRGKIVDFQGGQPIVKLTSSARNIKVGPHSWKLEEDGRVRAEVIQLPLRLAWAITIHKSQGMSLDAAEIDLSKSFTPGMGYVALSRLRSVEGLFLSGLNAMALRMHDDIYELDKQLKIASQALALTTVDEPEPSEDHQITEVVDEQLLKALKVWRSNRAAAEGVPAYIVAHDSVLNLIAMSLPRTSQHLLRLKGFGPNKLDKYGPEILSLINNQLGPDNSPQNVEASTATQIADFTAYRQATIAQYPRAFKRWQEDEESLLIDLFKQGTTLEAAAAILERQPSGLWARLQMLLETE